MFRACFLTLCLAASARADVVTTFDLQPVGPPAGTAEYDVSLTVGGASSATIEAVQFGVFGSSSALTAGGTDFSRFSFAVDPGLAGWAELASVGSGGLGLLAPLDPFAGPFITGPGSTPLGRLTVDLRGLPNGSYVVTLGGGPAGLNSDVGGTVDGNFEPSFAAADPSVAAVAFAQPNGEPVEVGGGGPSPNPEVPAPPALALLGVAGVTLLLRRFRSRS